MSKTYTWDKFVGDTKSNHKTQKQITNSSNSVQEDIRELISQLSPNAGPYVPDVIGAYIYQKCGNEGFPIFDDWYKNASDYPGTEKAQEEYASCAEIKHPVDKTSVLKLINDTSNTETHHTDEQTECLEKSDSDVTDEAESADNTNESRQSTVLDQYSLKGKSQELEAQLTELVYVLYQIALTGQSTVIFGPSNIGKTLIMLVLLIEAIQAGRINAEDVYYIDVDDSHRDLLKKLIILEALGVHIISDGYQGFIASRLPQLLDEISRNDGARGKIIILDTLKKFLDVMSKKQAAEWGKAIRRFTAKGGTVIALAHVNKHSNNNGKHIFAGVSDIVDDCDTAYIINKLGIDDNTQIVTVEFENIKRRGDVADRIGFMFSVDPSISYEERLASVEPVDEDKLEKIKMAESLSTDIELITVTTNCIEEDFNTKMRLRDEISRRTGISKRKAVQLIESYEGTDPSKHKWSFTMQEHGRKVYSVHTGNTDEK